MEPVISIGDQIESDDELYMFVSGFINEKEAEYIIKHINQRFDLDYKKARWEWFGK